MTDKERLRQQLENRQTMFTDADEDGLRELQEEIGGFSVIRRPDMPTVQSRGLRRTRIEVKFDE